MASTARIESDPSTSIDLPLQTLEGGRPWRGKADPRESIAVSQASLRDEIFDPTGL
jgi:hypothetical protein